MLETIIAIAVITIGIMSIITLAISMTKAQTETSEDGVAVNLAREGIEAVKNIRDSNWYNGNDFWQGILPSANGIIVNNFDNRHNATHDGEMWFLDFGISTDKKVYTDDNTGIYLNISGGVDPGVTPALYNREINTTAICHDFDHNEVITDICPPGYITVGIKVICRVYWKSNDRDHEIIIEDRLYNWKPDAK